MLLATDIEKLGSQGYFIRREWLGKSVALQARAAVQTLQGFQPAKIGRGADRQLNENIRGDELRWLDRSDAPAALAPVLFAFDGLKEGLNVQAWLGLDRVELQVARYLEPGALYQRHRDSFQGRAGRRVTCIYYLNEGWEPSHGGLLRLHLAAGPVDVPPVMDSLVVFLSEQVEHEVLPSFAERWAITAWMHGRTASP